MAEVEIKLSKLLESGNEALLPASVTLTTQAVCNATAHYVSAEDVVYDTLGSLCREHGLPALQIWKCADPTEDARRVNLDEAIEIAQQDPSLLELRAID